MVHDLPLIAGFDWDHGNLDKSWEKHNITTHECEEVFINDPLVFTDPEHSHAEKRFAAYGKTNAGKMLTVVFTWRGEKVRIISARNQSRRERLSHKF